MSKFIAWIQDYKVRRWLYGIATAVLVYLGGQGVISSVEQENIGNITSSVLNLGAAGVTALAARKADPVQAAKGAKPVVISDEFSIPDFVEFPTVEPEYLGLVAEPSNREPKHAAE